MKTLGFCLVDLTLQPLSGILTVGWGDCGRGRNDMYQYVLKEKGLRSSTAPKIDILTVILIYHLLRFCDVVGNRTAPQHTCVV